MSYAPSSLSFADGIIRGANSEHERVVEIIESLDLDEFQKDLIIHSISREDKDNE